MRMTSSRLIHGGISLFAVASALPPVLRCARGRLPPPPLRYRITVAGAARLEQLFLQLTESSAEDSGP